MPVETPPLRVKKPWRRPGRSARSCEVRTGRSAIEGLLESGRRPAWRIETAGLEELAHLVGGDEAVELAADHRRLVRPGADQGLGAQADAEARQELGLGEDRGLGALLAGGGHDRGE